MSDAPLTKLDRDRALLIGAEQQGIGATLKAYVRLSGPGWLQSTITLGGGAMSVSLLLGALTGVAMLWLQVLAVILGVVMLSAIGYVTLSTGRRPFDAINEHINPALGWGWLVATSVANMIFCMPQFALCYAMIDANLLEYNAEDPVARKLAVSAVLLALAGAIVALNARRGLSAKIFETILKGFVALIVICFFGVVMVLTFQGVLNWKEILLGYIPDPRQWSEPTGELGRLVAAMPEDARNFWSERVVAPQRSQMVAAVGLAVGINMTFLMPYSLLHRGWDKPFRGLLRFDLLTAMVIPYMIVTSCVMIAAATAFHGTADEALLSEEPEVFVTSPVFTAMQDTMMLRVRPELEGQSYQTVVANLGDTERQALLAAMAELPAEEKKVASSLTPRRAQALSESLAPLIGKQFSAWVFGIGVFAMGFSTIVMLMYINGFVYCEAVGQPTNTRLYVLGATVAGVTGSMWPLVAGRGSEFWFTVIASTFAAILLPVAYITFFIMMNSRKLLGSELPQGLSRLVWNLAMLVAVAAASVNAVGGIYSKLVDRDSKTVLGGQVAVGIVVVYSLLVAVGFLYKYKRGTQEPHDAERDPLTTSAE